MIDFRSTLRLLCCVAAIATSAAPVFAADDPALLNADRALVQAVARGGTDAAVNLLDTAATWTDVDGRTLRKPQIAKALPKPAIGDEASADTRRFDYGKVAVVLVDKGPVHTLRVWIRRPAGWRLLVFHELRSLANAPTATPGTGSDCINPCRTLPYQPKNADERGVVAAYQALETAAHSGDAVHWGDHVAEEFVLASSNGDRTFDKAARINGLKNASRGGIAPTRLLSAEMVGENNVVVMRSQHEPDKGDTLQITRVWVKRNGVWQETLSYQTAIKAQAAPSNTSR